MKKVELPKAIYEHSEEAKCETERERFESGCESIPLLFHSLKQELHFEIITCVATGLATRYMSVILEAHPDLEVGRGGGVGGRRRSSRSWAKDRARS